ncbi:high-affinity Cu transporter CTR1 LALA0_S01e08614g [Lachancea lanzarotensis]|uniref:Copper transport protein n=1 Tax=Lachancea lanzarotensis TaxID=1245769 RepID=A0A0C7MXY9_9SACH|nr:uncharacterized protein LALA0_S01e08614g [Lachancea lanzarotensis]CEP60345.1 LALA0S01e08614g1_1 [Lachancea lanzarotensis]
MVSSKQTLGFLAAALAVGANAHGGMDDSAMSMSMSMSMPMSSSAATMSSSGGMAMSTGSSSMQMDDSMVGMNSYLTPKYMNYPVLFAHLNAKNKGEAFGIFVLIVAAAFAYKFLLFTSWCLEVKWFKQWNPSSAAKTRPAQGSGLVEESDGSSVLGAQNYTQDLEFQSQFLPKVPNLFVQVFSPSVKDLCHDFIRLLLIFTSTMFIYMLMLVAMTFVLTYVFAVILGLALAEVFFNRWKICLIARWELKRQLERKGNCNGGEVCPCDDDDNENGGRDAQPSSSSGSSRASTALEKPNVSAGQTTKKKASCCCAPDPVNPDTDTCKCDGSYADNEAFKERQARELSSNNEQAGAMDVNLIPAEKFP